MTGLDYAKLACDTLMRKYKAEDLPPKGQFHYHQGVFLSGMYETYKLSKDEKYFNYIKEYIDSVITENGEIPSCDHQSMDDIQPGILLFPLYEKTKDIKYLKALNNLMTYMKEYPKTEEGCLFHKGKYPNQMWLDGIYMGGPICSEYGEKFHDDSLIRLVLTQAYLIRKHCEDPVTHLYYHACDYSKKAIWANKENGCSSEFWGRSISWVPIGIMDEILNLQNDPKYLNDVEKLKSMVKDLLKAVVKYQADDGRFFQVVDKLDNKDNWKETSCTCLFVASLYRAVRMNILDKSYLKYADKGYKGVISNLKFDNDNLIVNNVCIGTGVGDYTHYIQRPTSENDLHGVGAFLLMATSHF